MPWYAVTEKSTGNLVSLGSVVAPSLPGHLEAKEIGESPPDLSAQQWDPITKVLIPRPPVVMVDRVLTDLALDVRLSAVWTRLTAAQKTSLNNVLIEMLGPYRNRRIIEPFALQ